MDARQLSLIAVLLAAAFGAAPAQDLDTTATSAGERPTYAVAVDNRTVYTAKGPDLVILDVSDPTRPVETGRITLPDLIRDIVIRNGYAYVTAQMAGLRIVDISDRTDPREVGRVTFRDRAEDLTVEGPYAYIAARTAGVQIIDVSDPTRPEPVGSHKTEEQAVDVAVSGRYAHVAATYGGHRIVDISDPADPREIGSAARGSYDQGFSWGIAAAEPFVYVANVEIGLRRVDVSELDPSSTQNKAPTVELIQSVYRPADITVAGEFAYLADQNAGLRVFYAADPDTLFEVNLIETPGRVMDAAIAGGRAYVAARSAGIRIIDVSDPFNLKEIGFWDPDPMAVGIARRGNTIYAADRENGLRVYDISRPRSLRSVAVHPTAAEAVTVDDERAYVAGGARGLSVIDISDSAHVETVHTVSARDHIYHAAPSGDFVFAADGTAGLRVFRTGPTGALTEVSSFDPESPESSPFYNNPVAVRHVVIDQHVVYLLCNDGIRALDVSDPAGPKRLGFFPSSVRPVDAAAAQGHLLAAFDDGLRIIDISDPGSMREIGFLKTPSMATGIDTAGSRVYITDIREGLGVVDTANPADPEIIRFISAPDRAMDVRVVGEYAYLAASAAGIVVIHVRRDA